MVGRNETKSNHPELTEWCNASVTTPMTLFDLNGQANAYMFSIENMGVVGHIIVGGSDYGFPVFEAGQSPPPSIPTEEEVKNKIEQDLKKELKHSIGKPTKSVYLGFGGIFAIYDLDEQVAFNLISKKAFSVLKLKSHLPSSKDYKNLKKSTAESKPLLLESTSDSLTISYYVGSGRTWCGPCSGVSIGKYYRDEMEYSNLPSNDNMYDWCEYYMYTEFYGGATLPNDYGPGWLQMAENIGGYTDVFTIANDWFVTGGDYWNRVSDISNDWPIAIAAGTWYDDIGGNQNWPPDEAHWIAMKGYEYPYGDTDYAIVCTDSYTHDNYLWLDWDSLGSALFTCTIKPQ